MLQRAVDIRVTGPVCVVTIEIYGSQIYQIYRIYQIHRSQILERTAMTGLVWLVTIEIYRSQGRCTVASRETFSDCAIARQPALHHVSQS